MMKLYFLTHFNYFATIFLNKTRKILKTVYFKNLSSQ